MRWKRAGGWWLKSGDRYPVPLDLFCLSQRRLAGFRGTKSLRDSDIVEGQTCSVLSRVKLRDGV